jgi:DNA ligase 1
MGTTFRPMKGDALEEADIANIKFPVAASYKLDGFRVIARDGKPLTSALKLHGNLHIQKMFEQHALVLEGLDGELVVGEPNDPNVFDNTSGPVRRAEGEPDFTFWVFDLWNSTAGYENRLKMLQETQSVLGSLLPSFVQLVPVALIRNAEELASFEARTLELGYEGVMLRSLDGPYKYGRSTVKEGYLLKLKRFADAEAIIIGFEESQQNNNEATKDNFGRTKRSAHKANKVGKGTLGKFLLRGVNGQFAGVEFSCATGCLTAPEKQAIWDDRASWINTHITYEFLKIGSKDKPRHPKFMRRRELMDFEIAA